MDDLLTPRFELPVQHLLIFLKVEPVLVNPRAKHVDAAQANDVGGRVVLDGLESLNHGFHELPGRANGAISEQQVVERLVGGRGRSDERNELRQSARLELLYETINQWQKGLSIRK